MNQRIGAGFGEMRRHLLRGPVFDGTFIAGTMALALGLGALASISPEWFLTVLFVDIMLFANPHVVATWSRIGFSLAQARRHWFVVYCLPPLVLLAVTLVALAYEIGGLFTLYFIAQTWHVTRQSFGIARAYRRLDPSAPGDRVTDALIHLFPLWGLLHRCAAGPETFYGYPIHLPAVAPLVADAVGFVTLLVAAAWLARQARLAAAGAINAGHALFVSSHLVITGVAYFGIGDITLGWLVLNIWHNLQYLLYVWLQNFRRDAPSTAAPGRLQGPLWHAAKYIAVCLVAGLALYEVLTWGGLRLAWLGLPTVFILHFTVNFHHYLADGVIWKRRAGKRAAPA